MHFKRSSEYEWTIGWNKSFKAQSTCFEWIIFQVILVKIFSTLIGYIKWLTRGRPRVFCFFFYLLSNSPSLNYMDFPFSNLTLDFSFWFDFVCWNRYILQLFMYPKVHVGLQTTFVLPINAGYFRILLNNLS